MTILKIEGATLIDVLRQSHEQKVGVHVTNEAVYLFAEGYGDAGSADGHGSPVIIENHCGELRVIVWGDINSQEPTHVIGLDGARESQRSDE